MSTMVEQEIGQGAPSDPLARMRALAAAQAERDAAEGRRAADARAAQAAADRKERLEQLRGFLSDEALAGWLVQVWNDERPNSRDWLALTVLVPGAERVRCPVFAAWPESKGMAWDEPRAAEAIRVMHNGHYRRDSYGHQGVLLARGEYEANERALATYALPFVEATLEQQAAADEEAERRAKQEREQAEYRRQWEERDAAERQEREARQARLAEGRERTAAALAAADARLEAALPAARAQLEAEAADLMAAWWRGLPREIGRVEYTSAVTGDGEPYREGFLTAFSEADSDGWWTVIEADELARRKLLAPNTATLTEVELRTPEDAAADYHLAQRVTLAITVRAWATADGMAPLMRTLRAVVTVIRPSGGLWEVLGGGARPEPKDLVLDVDPQPAGDVSATDGEDDDEPPY